MSKKIDYENGEYYEEVYKNNQNNIIPSLWMENYYKGVQGVAKDIVHYKDKSILELGTGYGGFVEVLNNKGFKDVTGSDINDSIYNKNLPNKHLHLDILDITNMSSTYDLVFAFDVLEHIDDTDTALKNITNLLRKDGLLIFSVPYPSFKHLYDVYHTNMQMPYFYTNKFNRAGFELKKIKNYTLVPLFWRYKLPIVLPMNITFSKCITETFFCFKKSF